MSLTKLSDLVEEAEGRVVAGDHGLEVKKRRQASAATSPPMVKRSPIGTMPILGAVELVDQRHVAENVGVAHVVERLSPSGA